MKNYVWISKLEKLNDFRNSRVSILKYLVGPLYALTLTL